MADNNEKFKLNTRRWLAWGVGGVAIAVIGFTGVWGLMKGMMEAVTLSVGILGTTIGSIIVFYFGKKASEE